MRVVDILIVCALEEEAEEIISYLDINIDSKEKISGYECYFKNVERKVDPPFIRVAVVKLNDKGNLTSLHATSLLIKELSPYYVILAGICGGIINPSDIDLKLGDVVISDQIIYYEPAKIKSKKRQSREKFFFDKDNYNPDDNPLVLLAKTIEGMGWDALIKREHPEGNRVKPKVLNGVVCSGEKVIAHAKYAEKLRNLHEDVISVEMEAAGIALACQSAILSEV